VKLVSICLFSCFVIVPLVGQTASGHGSKTSELKYVVILSRHGVRAPSKTAEELNPYSAQPWPAWSVAPEQLTAHGARQMSLVGAFDRAYYSQAGLFASTGCADAGHVFIYADSNQRTRETARNLTEGMFPNCRIEISGKPLEKPDPLFHPNFTESQKVEAVAAVRQRIHQVAGGDDIDALTAKYKPQLLMLDRVLKGCATDAQKPCPSPKPPIAEPLFDVETKLKPGKEEKGKLLNFKGPIATASSLVEDLELEYAEGFPAAQIGWGNVNATNLPALVQLHSAATGVEQRAIPVARAQAGALLAAIVASLRQSVEGTPVAGALGAPGDKMLVLTGHDTNITNIAGPLNLEWMQDGRRDDVPPGAALVFELWKDGAGYSVKTFYTAQSLDQIRTLAPLTLASPPARVELHAFGGAGCSWEKFAEVAK
jgi:4-phytase/acid phosphatase